MAKGNKSREKKCLALDLDNTLIFAKKIEHNPKKAMIKKDKYRDQRQCCRLDQRRHGGVSKRNTK